MIKALLTNSISNVTVLFIRIGVTFIMTPLIVRALGNYDYGIWEIVIAITGYMGILDIGLQPAITKYVAQYNARANKKKLNSIYSSSLPLMAIAGFVCFIIFSVLALIAPDRIEQSVTNGTRYMLFFFILAIQVLIIFPGYVFQSFHHGFQRYHICNLVSIVTILLGNTILFLLLRKDGGLLSLVTITASMAYVRYTTYWLLLRHRNFGGFRLRIENFCWDTLKELATFGFKILIGGIATRISSQMDSLLIGWFLGPAMVTFYAIPRNLVNTAFNVVPAITQSFMPFFSTLDSRNQSATTKQVYIVASRYVLGLVFLLGIQLYFLGIPFLTRWIGPEYARQGRFVLYYLLFTKLYSISPFQFRYLTAIGRQMVFVKFGWYMTLLNVTLSLIFVRFWGIEGVALGTLIPVVIFYPFVFHTACKHIGVSVGSYSQKVLVPQVFPSMILLASLWILSSTFLLDNYFAILLIGTLSSILYIIMFSFFVVSQDERKFVIEKTCSIVSLHNPLKNNIKRN